MRTAKEIREALKGTRPVYIRYVFTSGVLHIYEARERKGELQVKTTNGWHTVLIGDEIWSPDY